MSKPNESYSSGTAYLTRVRHRKKRAKKTVGITLPPRLIAEARRRNLNISRITEQALSSILDYLQPQHKNESSKYFLGETSFQKKVRARSSARIEHRAFNPGVVGSIPAGPVILDEETTFTLRLYALGERIRKILD